VSPQAYIFELSAESFPQSALQNSFQIPVLVEFMGVWSGPCIQMSDLLSGLANEFAGQFIFAKVDIDEQPALREQYKIENVPTLAVLRNGEEVHREVGEMKEPELRKLLKEHGIYRESDELREQARTQHLAGDTQSAILLLTKAIQSDPTNTRVAMDMVQIFLDMGELEQAQGLFDRLPERDRESDMGKSLGGQLHFATLAAKTEGIGGLQRRIDADADDHAARFDLAVCLVAQHQVDPAMEQLFHIQQHDPQFRDGAAREMIGLLAGMLMGTDPDAGSAYRRRLANMLNEG